MDHLFPDLPCTNSCIRVRRCQRPRTRQTTLDLAARTNALMVPEGKLRRCQAKQHNFFQLLIVFSTPSLTVPLKYFNLELPPSSCDDSPLRIRDLCSVPPFFRNRVCGQVSHLTRDKKYNFVVFYRTEIWLSISQNLTYMVKKSRKRNLIKTEENSSSHALAA